MHFPRLIFPGRAACRGVTLAALLALPTSVALAQTRAVDPSEAALPDEEQPPATPETPPEEAGSEASDPEGLEQEQVDEQGQVARAREGTSADSDAASPQAPVSVDRQQVALEAGAAFDVQPCDFPGLEPPLPDADAFDWMRFDSGEWVGGDLQEMRDRRVTFDSDKLGVSTQDWDDVHEFRSARQYIYVDSELKPHEGPGLVTQEIVMVRETAGVISFPRSQLISVVSSSSREIDRWSLKLSAAATARAGNTESIDFTQYLMLRRQDHITRATLESVANLGNVNGTRTVQNWNGSFKADVFVHPNFYVTPAFAGGQHNYFQNLLFRGTAGGGVGVHALDLSWLTWDMDTLGAYQYTEYLSVTPPAEIAADDAVLSFGTTVQWDITGDIEFDVDWRTYLVVTELGRTYHNGTARFSMEMTEILDFDLTAMLNRIEDPEADENGDIPRSNDWTFTAGIGLELN